MANILGLNGYNKGDGTVNKLLAAYQNDIVDVDTGLGYSLNINTSNNVEFENFADRVFFQNYSEIPKTFNGTSWTQEYVGRTLISKYLKKFKSRMFLGYCKFASPQAPNDASGNPITFPSRVFYSDLFLGSNLTWGIEWGQNGATYSGNNIFEVTTTGGTLVQDFKARNIKVGDPLFITNGDASLTAKPYIVSSIESPYRLRVTENFPTTATSLHFWVGSNWFDVGLDDGDNISSFGENNNQLLCFKKFSLYRYNGVSLDKVKDSPGTTSNRSVINIGDYTIYFHGSNANTRKTGFYIYNGSNSMLISRAIQPFIDGISASNYSLPVAWREGKKYRCYVRTIINSPFDISIEKGAITWDSEGNQFSIDPIGDIITASGKFIDSSSEKYFIGTSLSQVHETASGNSFNGSPIPWAWETGNYFPATSSVANKFPRVQIVSNNAAGVEVLYKLAGKPMDDDDTWTPIGEIQHNFCDLTIPLSNNYGRGINLRFQETGTGSNTQLIQKIVILYIPQTTKIYEIFGE